MRQLLLAAILAAGLTACGSTPQASAPTAAPVSAEFNSGECNLVSDDDVNTAAGAGRFTKVVVSDAGCFWQETSMSGIFGAGFGISTWWYRGSDIDSERRLEMKAGRELTDVSFNGNSGFQASDANACSLYVGKGDDVIAWSIQTLNPASLPDLCSIVERLANLTQERVT
jgi:hypothetical protein